MDSCDTGDGVGDNSDLDQSVCNDLTDTSASSKRLKLSGAANRKRKDEELRKSAAQGCHRLHIFFPRTTTSACK
jgi:hypothetical protein